MINVNYLGGNMKPGIYYGITNADYHGGPGVSKSLLDLVRRSPLHARYALDHANDNEPTPAQALGTAFHTLLLEPDVFDAEYVLAPKFDRRTKQGKADAEAFALEHVGKQPLQADAWEQLHAMRDAVMAHPAARALLTGAAGLAEQSVYWNDPATGQLCRCRPDFWRQDGIIVDVKTADDASQDGFARAAYNWRYHVQHAFYVDGINTMRDQTSATDVQPVRAFVFLVVEKKPPYAVAVYSLEPDAVELGRAAYRADLDRMHDCITSNKWPGYGDVVQSLNLPRWAFISDAA